MQPGKWLGKISCLLTFRKEFDMKILSVIISTVIALFSLHGFAEGKEKTCEFEVKGMTCVSCSTTVKIGVKKLDGIKSVDASSEKANAVVLFDPSKTDEVKVEAAINKTGYEAKLKQCNA